MSGEAPEAEAHTAVCTRDRHTLDPRTLDRRTLETPVPRTLDPISITRDARLALRAPRTHRGRGPAAYQYGCATGFRSVHCV
jgi:hypothetical protein